MSPPSTVYLVDASIYIFRAYFSLPDEWFSPEGDPVNALCGYVQFVLKFLNDARPEQLAIAYDESLGACFRNEIYADYKSSRVLPDDALAYQLAACKAFTEVMAIPTLASARFEADDIIASLANQAQQHNQQVIIVSRDKDLGQLLRNKDFLWDFAADRQIDRRQFVENFGVLPEQMVDYLALVGDSIDDIPGVPGIGKKTAAALLQQFGSIEQMLDNPGAVVDCGMHGAKSIAVKLVEYREQMVMAQQLARLETGMQAIKQLSLDWHPPGQDRVRHFLSAFGLDNRFRNQLEQCYWWQN